MHIHHKFIVVDFNGDDPVAFMARPTSRPARAWLDEHQWVVAARLRRPFGER
jgi:hypothetical protein